MNNNQYNNLPMALLRKTEKKDLYWISFERIIKYLNEEGIPLSSIQEIHNYIIFQQRNRYIPILKRTYICLYEDTFVVLSQGKYSAEMRLAFMSTSSYKQKWESLKAPPVTLVRLRDAIELFALCDSQEDCQELLYSMGDIHA